jgi:hypothetical protein
VTASGILNIAGYSDVKLAIDGKQPTLTGSSNITTGTINASNVTASGILNIAGYTDVKVAIDGKQPTLTGSSNITTGTINATNVTASGNITTGTIAATDITTSGTVVSSGRVSVNNLACWIPNPNVRTAIDGKQPTLTGSTI